MERIRLTKEEKVLFRRFSRKDISIPEGMSEGAFNYAATGLEDKELIYTEWKLTTLSHAGLTPKGSAYLSLNPGLRNPFPWDIIMKAATIIAAVAATAALFISYCRLLMW